MRTMPRSLFVLLLLPALPAWSQTAPAAHSQPGQVRMVRLAELLAEAERTNLELAANRFNLPIAEAQVTLARLFPDPQLTAGIDAYDLSAQKLPASLTYGLAETIELGGKRSARIAEANAGRSLAEAQLDDFFETLRVNATNAFVDALVARQILERKRRTLASVEKLVSATEQRLRAGDVSPTALWQVKVEAERFRSDVIAAEGDVEAADYALGLYVGPPETGEAARLQPMGELKIAPREFDAEALVAKAVETRSDLVVSLRQADVAHAHVGVAQANRWIDPTLAAGITQSPSDPASGTPAAQALSLTVSLPVPFSRRTHGDLDAARATAQQSETQVRAARQRAGIEVRQALARYEATRRSLAVYTGEILTNADRAFEATLYSYQRGATRLLELLDAQRTVDDVYLSYIGAVSAHVKALVALERAAGLWDIDL